MQLYSPSLASVKSRLVLPFLVPAYPGSTGLRAVKRNVCTYVYVGLCIDWMRPVTAALHLRLCRDLSACLVGHDSELCNNGRTDPRRLGYELGWDKKMCWTGAGFHPHRKGIFERDILGHIRQRIYST